MKKTVLVGVSGGIAAYKSCELVSLLKKRGYNVKVVMTKNATEFVAPLSFETLSGNEVMLDTFAEKKEYDVKHVSIAKEADIFVIAPATADVIAKFANGICDDMLTTVYAAFFKDKLICPAMNTAMYNNAANLNNISLLQERGILFVEPTSGLLACGDVGKGRMAEAATIADRVDELLMPRSDFKGKTVLITAGATVEDIDGVRFISNYSSGKMGVALAEAVTERGGRVVFVRGNMSVPEPEGCEIIKVKSTIEMYDACMRELDRCDVIIKAAAPADYRVEQHFENKLKADKITLSLVKNPDIAKAIGEVKGRRILVAFAAETTDLLRHAADKLINKNADIVVANDVTQDGAGFGVDTNIATILYADGRMECLPLMDKRLLAHCILDGILSV